MDFCTKVLQRKLREVVDLEVCVAHRHKGSVSKLHAEHLQPAIKIPASRTGSTCGWHLSTGSGHTMGRRVTGALLKASERHFIAMAAHSVHSRTQMLFPNTSPFKTYSPWKIATDDTVS